MLKFELINLLENPAAKSERRRKSGVRVFLRRASTTPELIDEIGLLKRFREGNEAIPRRGDPGLRGAMTEGAH
jgi:hypothetical protein